MSQIEFEAGLSVTPEDLRAETIVMDKPLSFGDEDTSLKIFWDKRKREAGKITGQTRLHPKANKRLGRAQNNWRPTSDLKGLLQKPYFVLGSVVVLTLSVVGFLVYEKSFSPGPISDSHAASFQKESLLKRNIANQSNSHSCSNCHGVQQGHAR